MPDQIVPLSARMYAALNLTFKLHGRDTRKSSNVPMISHMLAVCALVLQAGGDEDEGIAALLHDPLKTNQNRLTEKRLKIALGR